MGQGPLHSETVYLVVGSGRLARHLHFYLTRLGLNWRSWSRREGRPLSEALPGVTHAMLAISDDALPGFLSQHAELAGVTRIHFSGSLHLPDAWGVHPLMTFGPELYPAADYPQIALVVDAGAPPLDELLPGWPNPNHRLEPALKARYHAECVLSGNFTTLLWGHFFETLETRLGVPRSAALPYLRHVLHNLEASAQPLTGPLARRDRGTVERNLAALEGDPYRQIYLDFVKAHAPELARPLDDAAEALSWGVPA